MQKPVLVVMAAGMGSRFGGLKQLSPVGGHGELLMDYSIYDARRAGFETVVFVVKPELEAEFHRRIGDRLSRAMEVRYVHQRLDDLPAGFTVPEGRIKPWGTAQAALAARHVVTGPFAVINSDDYYGPHGFQSLYDYLTTHPDTPEAYSFAMVGYLLENTVTEHGSVARGVCVEDRNHNLVSVTERTRIETTPEGPRFTEDGGESWTSLPGDTLVSMNLWGFTRAYLEEAWARFPAFLEQALASNPMKGEYYLPAVVSQLIAEEKARVRVLPSRDKWYGMTYQDDLPGVVEALARMTREGLYPEELWQE